MGDHESAKQFFDAGLKAVNNKANDSSALQTAYQLFASACITDPSWEQAWYWYGNNNSDLKCPYAAVAAWRRALACEASTGDRAKVMVNLGWQLYFCGQDQEALKVTHEALKIDPELVLGWHNLSLIYGRLDQPEKAIEMARKAYELDPNDIHAPMGLAFSLLFAGQFQEGFKHFEKRFEWRLHHFLHYPYPKWTGEPDKTVFLVADQGLGDTLSFSRFVPAAAKRAKFIHALVQPALIRPFTYAFAGLTNVQVLPLDNVFLPADCWSTFVSLPFALDLTDEEVRDQPALEFPIFDIEPTWKIPDCKIHIGIAWAGSPLNDIDKDRSIPVHHFFELYRVPGIQCYSLQVGDRSREAREQGGGALFYDLSGHIQDVADTWSIMQHLDLIICCESGLGHIAGAIDKECIIPYSYIGRDYRAGINGKNPLWYKNHKFFNQGSDMRWEPVFAEIVEYLKKRVK